MEALLVVGVCTPFHSEAHMRSIVALLAALAVAGCGEHEHEVFTSKIYCNDFMVTDTGTGLGVEVLYKHYTIADDSVIVSCDVIGQIGSSGFMVFDPKDPGYGTGTCLVAYDVDEASEGMWNFTLNADRKSARAVYLDPGSPIHGRSKTMSCRSY